MRDEAKALDAADELAPFRERFHLPEGIVYLDGNSLGALPKQTKKRLNSVICEEWGEGLIRSWNEADWIDLPQRVGAKIAPLIGAKPEEVIACDSTSVNLFKLIAAALAMRPGRRTILSEPGNFPTDLYMIQGLEAQGLARQKLVSYQELEAAIDDDTALLLLTHIHYKTGRMHDMARLTKAAHEKGALVLWDLSHSVGAVPLELDAKNVDFAVGCGYKYLCGGPGAPAFAYVAQRHLDAPQGFRDGVNGQQGAFSQPLSGWFGHAAPFAFDDSYEPAPGIDRLLAGTPPILGLSALEAGVDLIADIGVERLWQKSHRMSEFLRSCLAQLGCDLELVSPADPSLRGSQLSFQHEEAFAICQALIARGIIGDFRAPDILRLGFAPAYLTFADIARTAEELSDILSTRAFDRLEFRQRRAVT
ncbi:kynureninase [Altererythrobacter aurantiacus]|uniref:Kynureninase n=1 Tax=Parapontixanthobacter aurantiacus TaxID=1463599 RepID=A0A844ZGT3_9SPHN|nr:kynureninase [Parapontixanthobacter aurantiacus]MXO86200.1 kynureninase [Parapontixanthobacter aurantiacus]